MVDCIVEFDYAAEQEDELSIKSGQTLTNVKKMDGGWWEGELNGKRGVFPDNFVKEIPLEKKGQSKTTGTGGHVPEIAKKLQGSINMGPSPAGIQKKTDAAQRLQAKVVHSYVPENSDELRLEPGDIITITKKEEEGWWEGELNGQTGMFPSNFVEALDDVSDAVTETTAKEQDVTAAVSEIQGRKVKGVGLGNIFKEGNIKLRTVDGQQREVKNKEDKTGNSRKGPMRETPAKPDSREKPCSSSTSDNDNMYPSESMQDMDLLQEVIANVSASHLLSPSFVSNSSTDKSTGSFSGRHDASPPVPFMVEVTSPLRRPVHDSAVKPEVISVKEDASLTSTESVNVEWNELSQARQTPPPIRTSFRRRRFRASRERLWKPPETSQSPAEPLHRSTPQQEHGCHLTADASTNTVPLVPPRLSGILRKSRSDSPSYESYTTVTSRSFSMSDVLRRSSERDETARTGSTEPVTSRSSSASRASLSAKKQVAFTSRDSYMSPPLIRDNSDISHSYYKKRHVNCEKIGDGGKHMRCRRLPESDDASEMPTAPSISMKETVDFGCQYQLKPRRWKSISQLPFYKAIRRIVGFSLYKHTHTTNGHGDRSVNQSSRKTSEPLKPRCSEATQTRSNRQPVRKPEQAVVAHEEPYVIVRAHGLCEMEPCEMEFKAIDSKSKCENETSSPDVGSERPAGTYFNSSTNKLSSDRSRPSRSFTTELESSKTRIDEEELSCRATCNSSFSQRSTEYCGCRYKHVVNRVLRLMRSRKRNRRISKMTRWVLGQKRSTKVKPVYETLHRFGVATPEIKPPIPPRRVASVMRPAMRHMFVTSTPTRHVSSFCRTPDSLDGNYPKHDVSSVTGQKTPTNLECPLALSIQKALFGPTEAMFNGLVTEPPDNSKVDCFHEKNDKPCSDLKSSELEVKRPLHRPLSYKIDTSTRLANAAVNFVKNRLWRRRVEASAKDKFKPVSPLGPAPPLPSGDYAPENSMKSFVGANPSAGDNNSDSFIESLSNAYTSFTRSRSYEVPFSSGDHSRMRSSSDSFVLGFEGRSINSDSPNAEGASLVAHVDLESLPVWNTTSACFLCAACHYLSLSSSNAKIGLNESCDVVDAEKKYDCQQLELSADFFQLSVRKRIQHMESSGIIENMLKCTGSSSSSPNKKTHVSTLLPPALPALPPNYRKQLRRQLTN